MIERDFAESIKRRYPPGTRIVVDYMDDPHPIPSGMHGTVDMVDDIGTIHCKFDNGRYLGLVPGEDAFHIARMRNNESREAAR